MATLKFNENRDLDIENGRVTVLTGVAAIAQSIVDRLSTNLGECVYAVNLGVPWFDVIFRKGSEGNLPVLESVITQIILQDPRVIEVNDFFFSSYDPFTRSISLSCSLQTENGEIDLTNFKFQFAP